jgi:hypothetical protein
VSRPVGKPVGDAELYQRLRAHLAFLKMPDAAEALPGLLDHARTQQVRVLAALEHLMAIEVDAVESRRRTGSTSPPPPTSPPLSQGLAGGPVEHRDAVLRRPATVGDR